MSDFEKAPNNIENQEAKNVVDPEVSKKMGAAAMAGAGVVSEKIIVPKTKEEIIGLIESGKLTHEQLTALRQKIAEAKSKLVEDTKAKNQVDVNEEDRRQIEEIKQEAAAIEQEGAKKNLYEKLSQHKNFRKVAAVFLAGAIAVGGFVAGRSLAKKHAAKNVSGNSVTMESDQENTTDKNTLELGEGYVVNLDDGGEETSTTDAGETVDDGFEELDNGVKYNPQYYSAEYAKQKGGNHDFTKDNSELWGNKEGTIDELRDLVTGNPEALAAYFYDLDDSAKGDLAKYSRTQLDTMLKGDNGAELQQKMLNAVNNFLDGAEVEFTEAEAGKTSQNTFIMVSENGPSGSVLATSKITFKGGEKLFVIQDGDSIVSGMMICFNNEQWDGEDDGSVVIENTTPTPETQTVTSDKPVVPTTPDKPDVPDTPTTPNKPVTPDTPVVPDVPDIPDTPDVPDVPDTPDKPDVPDTPTLTPKGEDTHAGNDVTKLPVTPEKPESGATPVEATEDNHVDAETNPGAEVKAEDMSDKGREGIGEVIMQTPEVTEQEITPTYSPEIKHQEENEVPVIGDGDTRTFEEVAPNVNEAAAAENTPGSAENGTRTDEELANRFAQLRGASNNAESSTGGATEAEINAEFGLGETNNNGGNQ